MRKINKGAPIAEFLAFKKTNPTNWDDFGGEAKMKTRDWLLMEEQHFRCGYTEIFYCQIQSWNIEHFRKKGIFPNLTFDWNNLIYAIKSNDFGGDYKDKVVKNQSIYTSIFNPVVDYVQYYFYYNTNGEISPNPTETDAQIIAKVNKTVEVFNLNHKKLSERRATLIEMIEMYKENSFDNQSIKDALANSDFLSVIEQYA